MKCDVSVICCKFVMVNHVGQTWNSILKGLERIDSAFSDFEIGEEQ